MKKAFCLTILLLIFVLTGCGDKDDAKVTKEGLTKIKIAWMTPNFYDAIKDNFTENLKESGLNGEVMKEAEYSYYAFNNLEKYDVIFVGDLAAALLYKSNRDWVIVGRTGNIRTAIVVPPKSEINSVEELRGKLIGGPLAAFRTMVDVGREYDMEPHIDYELTNLDFVEQRKIISDPEASTWEKIDALVSHDPAISYLEEKGAAKLIYSSFFTMPILAKKSFIENNPEALVKFFRALNETMRVFRVGLAKEQKIKIEGLDLEILPKILERTYSQESNFNEDSDEPMRFYFYKEEIDSMQSTFDIVFALPVVEPPINIIDYIDTSFAEKVTKRQIKTE